MALKFFMSPTGQPIVQSWFIGDDLQVLATIQENALYCLKVECSSDELKQILQRTRNVPNLADLNDTNMTFIGDWAKMIAANVTNLFDL